MRRRALLTASQSSGGGSVDYAINIDNYLTIEALEDDLVVEFSIEWDCCEYCIDGDGVWTTYWYGDVIPSINKGQIISFKGQLVGGLSSSYGIGTFIVSKRFNLKGNCMSLLFYDDAANNFSLEGTGIYGGYGGVFDALFSYTPVVEVSQDFLPATTLDVACYYGMFSGCTNLIKAPELPATTLHTECYRGMFSVCTSLTIAPELPATTLAIKCYSDMFSDCTSLTTAPELPALDLISECYDKMFRGCSKLNYIKAMFISQPSTAYTNEWVYGVSSTGTFVKNKNATWTASVDKLDYAQIPEGWVVVEE